MGFFSKIINATLKTVLTPIAVVKDAVDVASGEDPENTENLLESAKEDLKQAGNDIVEGEL